MTLMTTAPMTPARLGEIRRELWKVIDGLLPDLVDDAANDAAVMVNLCDLIDELIDEVGRFQGI